MFRRVDLCPPVDIPVGVMSVSDTRMATTISPGGDPGGPKVQTIEHLLSACAGLGLSTQRTYDPDRLVALHSTGLLQLALDNRGLLDDV